MTFHLINLPHTQTTKAFGQCAYTQKVRKFADMMTSRGHEVILYASEENEANVKELVTCITKEQQQYFLEECDWWPKEYYKIPFKKDFVIWEIFNKKVIEEIQKRIKPGDFILQTAGKSQEEITNAFPYQTIEWAVGYEGICSNYRVFESYPWMHHVYGIKRINVPNPLDAVIPNFFEVSDFPFKKEKENFLLFMSRPVKGKGIKQAIEIARKTNMRLVVAGATPVNEEGVEYVGYADFKKRGDLMSRATALLCPTLAIEPFGGVVIEAALCGTPSITTDWGAFTETVEQGKTGFKCRSMDEFVAAVDKCVKLDADYIRSRAVDLYSTHAVAIKFEQYFERLKPIIDRAPIFT